MLSWQVTNVLFRAPLKGELSPQVTEGYFRKTSHNRQKIPHKNPSTAYRRFPSPKGEALLHLGSPLGELSPQVTEGYFRKTSHIKQKIPQEPLHRLTAVPLVLSGPLCPAGISPPRGESPLSGEALLHSGSPVGHP